MPLARLRVELYGTPAQLTQAKAAITSQYPAASKIFDRNDGTIVNIGDRSALTVDVRLKTQADGDALRDKAQAAIATLQSFGVTGVVTYHQCTHNDANVVACTTQTLVV